MKVTLATHGGQAAAINLHLPPREVDTDTLPRPAAAELSRLVAAAKAGNAAPADGERGRDAMSYVITVEERGQSTRLAQSDLTMSAQFAALLNWLQEHAPWRLRCIPGGSAPKSFDDGRMITTRRWAEARVVRMELAGRGN